MEAIALLHDGLHDVTQFAASVASDLVASGTLLAITQAVKRFKKRVPKATVLLDGEPVEDDDEDDDEDG